MDEFHDRTRFGRRSLGSDNGTGFNLSLDGLWRRNFDVLDLVLTFLVLFLTTVMEADDL